MKCEKCQNDMIQAKNSWLCVNCGHIEAVSPDSVPLVSKKSSPAKAISQDMATPAPKPKLDEPKAAKPTEPEGDKKSEVKPEVPEILPSQPEPKSEKLLAPPVIQDNNKAESKSADMPAEKNDTEAKPNEVSIPSVAPSAAELHPPQAVVVPSPTKSSSTNNDVVLPIPPAKDASKPDLAPQTPTPVDENKSNIASSAPTATPESSLTTNVEANKSAVVQPSEPKTEAIIVSAPELVKSEPDIVAEAAPPVPVIPSPTTPSPAAEPMPLPVADAPVPATSPSVAEIAPAPATLKTVAPETHPAPVNVGLIIWIIVAVVSFIALVVFGYAFYKGIDLFAGLRK